MSNDSGAVTIVPLADLTADGATQWRVKNSSKAIEDMAEHLRAGGTLPPIDVFVGRDGKKHVGDGHHRIGACKTAGLDQIPARLHKGDGNAAYLFGWRANKNNRAVRSRREDIKNAALGMLLRKIVKSDRELAKEIGVNNSTISRWRAEWESSVALQQIDKREVKRGETVYTQNVAKIGKGQSQETRQPALPGTAPTRASRYGQEPETDSDERDELVDEILATEIDKTEPINKPGAIQHNQDVSRPNQNRSAQPGYGEIDESNAVVEIIEECNKFLESLEHKFDSVDPRHLHSVRNKTESVLLKVTDRILDLLPPDGTRTAQERSRFGVIQGGRLS
jgi:hypothetical protein